MQQPDGHPAHGLQGGHVTHASPTIWRRRPPGRTRYSRHGDTMALGLTNDIKRALDCYRDERPFVRLFVFARHLLAPLGRIAAEVPARGKILDLGCGHGLFANLLAVTSPE